MLADIVHSARQQHERIIWASLQHPGRTAVSSSKIDKCYLLSSFIEFIKGAHKLRYLKAKVPEKVRKDLLQTFLMRPCREPQKQRLPREIQFSGITRSSDVKF